MSSLATNRSQRARQDPTGQARNRRRATAVLKRRLTNAEKKVKRLFRSIPNTRRTQVKLVNQEVSAIYDYDITADQQQALAQEVAFILNQEVLETQFDAIPQDWYWKEEVELPYRQGTGDELVLFAQLLAAALLSRAITRTLSTRPLSIRDVIFSAEYQQALNKVYVRNFNSLKGMSEKTSSQVMQQINAGLGANESPNKIAGRISKRFDVSKSDAERIADTEINWAYNDGQMNANDIAAAQTGLRSGVLHISALLPTTRAHHAARHGNVYTTAQQNEWWNTGSNRIRCHCSVRGVLINRQGKVIETETQEEIKAEKSFFNE